MRKIIFLIVLLFPALAFAQPSIKIDKDTYDFGEVKQGTQLEHIFEFENAGTEDLEIKELKPS